MSMTISIDDDLKRDFSEVCANIGLSASAAFTVFAKRVVRDGRIPFDLDSRSTHERAAREREWTINAGILRGYQDYQEGRTLSWEAARAELGIESLEVPA